MGIFLKKFYYLFTDFSFYKLVALLGIAIRLFVLPNPFELLNVYLFLPWWAWKIILFFADYLIVSDILYWLSYGTVGIMYEAGEAPAWGSILYTIIYSAYVGAIYCLILFYSTFVLILVSISLVAIIVALFVLSLLVFRTTIFN